MQVFTGKAKEFKAYHDLKKGYKESDPVKWYEIKRNFKKVCKNPAIPKMTEKNLMGMFTWDASANGHSYWSDIYHLMNG